jgi:hypothetical protein
MGFSRVARHVKEMWWRKRGGGQGEETYDFGQHVPWTPAVENFNDDSDLQPRFSQ